jgi:hypothetical protein
MCPSNRKNSGCKFKYIFWLLSIENGTLFLNKSYYNITKHFLCSQGGNCNMHCALLGKGPDHKKTQMKEVCNN